MVNQWIVKSYDEDTGAFLDQKTIKKWNGSKWVDANVYTWNATADPGQNWYLGTDRTTTTNYTKTYNSTWHQTYKGNNAPYAHGNPGTNVYQGSYGGSLGEERAAWGLPYNTIKSDLTGASIQYAQVYFTNISGYPGYATTTGELGAGRMKAVGDSFIDTTGIDRAFHRNFLYFNSGEVGWRNVNPGIFDYIKSGTAGSLVLKTQFPNDRQYYGVWGPNITVVLNYNK